MKTLSLFRLLQLSDPMLPIGGYAHSYGLETYVQKGIVHDVTTAKGFVEAMLQQSVQHTDAAFFSLAFDAVQAEDLTALQGLDEECNAIKLARETRQASQKLGIRLSKIYRSLHQNKLMKQYETAAQNGTCNGHYSIMAGGYAFVLGIDKEEALSGFYYNVAAGFITNCVKLIPISQQAGQELLFSLHPLLQQLTQHSMKPDKDMIGLCCAGFDLRSMQHEQLYSRLYMS